MIRSAGMIAKNAAYVPPDMNNYGQQGTLDTLWHEWSLHEMTKRFVPSALLLPHPHLYLIAQRTLVILPPRYMPLHLLRHALILPRIRNDPLSSMRRQPMESLYRNRMVRRSPKTLSLRSDARTSHRSQYATRFWRASAATCTGGMDEIKPIQSFYPHACYSQEPVYDLLG